MLSTLNNNYSNTFSVTNLDEDTFLQFTLEPLLNIIFKNVDSITIDGSSTTLESNNNARKKFDPTLVGKKADYCVSYNSSDYKLNLVINESKSMKSVISCSNEDDIKLAYLSKDAVDCMHKYQVGSYVITLLLQGTKLETYIMDLKYSSFYCYFKLCTCYLPVDQDDFGRVLSLFKALINIKHYFTEAVNGTEESTVVPHSGAL